MGTGQLSQFFRQQAVSFVQPATFLTIEGPGLHGQVNKVDLSPIWQPDENGSNLSIFRKRDHGSLLQIDGANERDPV